ncbi:NAD(P)/FAD-dependent oxidoreductase [Chengkuizengella axinellae]|uniref:Aerobic glycerol-3-phosphate dehydrogenase n=1 Tax=Chengkuizengella axinellae TaxID=3064388 RepID=A0ABT9J1P0_9BACL|nr:FAD-dependent oxidoreductase [Chengkuizengella sp. 2205SS18-9]MDP5275529.1 FAD-dependent oxidoreductase [Chengkuizengella sp. 2205SS18-9]
MDSRNTEVLIIGGGVIGAAIAYYTAKSGMEVTVIDKGDIASGTSSRCDGNILAIDKEPGFDSQMSLESQKLVDQLSKELDLDFEYRAPGSILVCESEDEMIAAESWVERQKKAGLSFKMLDRNDIKQESPYFADDLLGGLECETDSTINPYLFTYSLFHGATKYGAKVMLRCEVEGMSRDSVTGLFKVNTPKGEIIAKKVVNAGGIWAPYIGNMLGLDIPIKPRKGHIIVASRDMPVGMRKVMEFGYLMSKFGKERTVDEETDKYGVALVFEPTESQNFLIGSSRQFVGFDTRVDMDVVNCIARRTIRFYPKIADFIIIRTYSGLRPWTPDHLPIVSPVEEIPNYYIAAGHEGDGISLAAITGKLMTELLQDQINTIIPTDPIRYSRFKNVSTIQT